MRRPWRSVTFSRAAAATCERCFCFTSCNTFNRSRSRRLNVIRSVSIGPSAIHESGHFYFAQTGHSHFAATVSADSCCTSLIMSPSGLVRNVPYTVTSRGGPVEEDSDEHEGTSARRGIGKGEEQDAWVERCGEDIGVELPADEETLEAVSRGRSEGSAAPQCGKRFESREAGRVPAEGSAADPEEVFGNRAGAIWTDAGSGALSG